MPVRPFTVTFTKKVFGLQLTLTLLTLAEPMVPTPPPTRQVCAGAVGGVFTVTVKLVPLGSGWGNMKVPLPVITRSSPTPSLSARPVPVRPLTEPPRVNAAVVQTTSTVPTEPSVTVPAPPVMLQVCAGDVGCESTDTA